MVKVVAADAVPGLLHPGMKVFVQGVTGEPTALLTALAENPSASDGVHYLSCMIPGFNRTDPASFHANARLTGFFVTADVRESYEQGKMRFMPLHYSAIYAHLSQLPFVDAALIQVSPPNGNGECSLGISVDFQLAVLERAKLVIAEVNRRMPGSSGSPTIAYDRIDYAVETDRPLPVQETGDIPEALSALGRNVADLIDDGDTIQIGIGRLPAAILAHLDEKRDLGLQGGMITDEVMRLSQAGVLTGAAKSIDRDKTVCGAALGSQALYDWLRGNDHVLFRSASYTHNVRVIAEIDNFVSINAILEIDLFGQANGEMIDGRQVSGTGGMMDFVTGARLARNGRSILAMPATAGRGKLSRIVPWLDASSVVTCPRADVDYVVTEHGAARLRDKSEDERAEVLIAVAAPEFRPELTAAWQALRGSARPKRD